MLRLFTALLFASTVALADEPPKKPAEPVKAAPTATVTLKTLTVKDGMLITAQVLVPEVVAVPVTTVVNGMKVTVIQNQTVQRVVAHATKSKLKDLKATGTDGKDIPGDDLEKKLKDGGTVVMHTGKLDAEFRKLFKDGTVFVEEAMPTPPAPPK